MTGTQPPGLPALLRNRDAYQHRLELILPREITGTTATANLGAAAAALTMMYVGAIDKQNPIRPVAFVRMSDAIAARTSDADRRAYYHATTKQQANRLIDALCDQWGIGREGFYAANSREGPRDETLPRWEENGALIVDRTIPATSSRGRYTLTPQFAALLDPELTGEPLLEAIAAWQMHHLTPVGRGRAAARSAAAKRSAAVVVDLPHGGQRSLATGGSSAILKAFIEEGATRLMKWPTVVFISQSAENVNVVDHALLTQLGLDLDALKLLPDTLMMDLAEDRGHLWFIEVVESDGPVHDTRRAALLKWAVDSGVPEEDCRFLTAFRSRTAGPARKLFSVLARNSYAWFADEPDAVLSWHDLP